MSLLVTLNGANYIIPQTNEVGWGSNLDDYFVAIAAGVLQKTGGSFTLSAETDFGASYGLKSLYYKSRATNVAATGALRLANAETGIVWRNFLNNADLALTVNASNQLTFNGVPIQPNTLTSAHILVGNGSNIATDVAMSGNIGIDNTGATTIQAGVIVNSMVNASAAIARSKLATLTVSRAMVTDGSGFDAVSATTATELGYVNGVTSAIQTQLDAKQTTTLTSGNILVGNVSNVAASVAMSGDITITNAGVTAIGAGKIVNAQVNASAAIAYSKLALSGSIVNADVSTSAAIAITKVAIGTANQIIGTNNGATANEFKTLTATANQVSVTHGAGTVTFATPQDIGTSSAVRFGSLTLGGALDASSILSLTSTSKGFLPPVMTTTQKNAISTPTDGLIVYDSSLAQLFLRAASAWTPLSVGGGSGTVASGTQYQLGYYATSTNTISGNSGIVTDASNNLGVGGTPNLNSATRAITLIAGTSGTAVGTIEIKGSRTVSNAQFAGWDGYHQSTRVTSIQALRGTADDEGYLTFATKTTAASLATALTLGADQKATFAGVVSVPVGSVSAPSINFGTANSGIYGTFSTHISFAVNGVQTLDLQPSAITVPSGVQINLPNGSVSAPGLTFSTGSQNTGIYLTGTSSMRFASAGVNIVSVAGGTFEIDSGGITAGADNTLDIGASGTRFANLYCTNIKATNAGISVTGNQIYPVVQIVTATTSSTTTTSSSSYVDTNLTLSITPKFNTSKILVYAVGTLLISGSQVLAQASATLTRNTSTTLGGQTCNVLGQVASQNFEAPVSLLFYDSPATTSATTYKVQILRTVVGGTGSAQFPCVGDAQIVAIEIAQ